LGQLLEAHICSFPKCGAAFCCVYAQETPMIIGFSRVLPRIFASECGNAVAEPVGDFLNSFIHRNKYAPLTNHLTLRLRSNVIVSSRS
jgi:hypothetical protein